MTYRLPVFSFRACLMLRSRHARGGDRGSVCSNGISYLQAVCGSRQSWQSVIVSYHSNTSVQIYSRALVSTLFVLNLLNNS